MRILDYINSIGQLNLYQMYNNWRQLELRPLFWRLNLVYIDCLLSVSFEGLLARKCVEDYVSILYPPSQDVYS